MMTKICALIVLILAVGFCSGVYFSQNHMNASAGTCVNSFTNFVGGIFQQK